MNTCGYCKLVKEELDKNNIEYTEVLTSEYQKEWNKVIKIDETMRQALEDRGLVNKLYLHRSCTPLKDVEFADQQELFMCEEGFCGL